MAPDLRTSPIASSSAKVDTSNEPPVDAAHERSSRTRKGVWFALVAVVSATLWAAFPFVRRAWNGWRALSDGVAVQRSLQGDMSIDDEFARVAFEEFARLGPEADVGQLHLHLVRPARRDGWTGGDERPWLLADLADLRPIRATSYFETDTRISEAYADLLEQLKSEIYVDAKAAQNFDRLRKEFTSSLRTAAEATKRAQRRSSANSAQELSASVGRLLVARTQFANWLGKLPRLGLVERAYLDFMSPDAQVTLMTPSGVEAPFAKVELSPNFERWVVSKKIQRVVNATVLSVRRVVMEGGQGARSTEIKDVTLEAKDVKVFRFARSPWFRQELVTQFRQTARSSGVFGPDGSLGVLPVGAIFAREVTVTVRTSDEDAAKWVSLVQGARSMTFELPHSALTVEATANTRKGTETSPIRIAEAQDVKLVGLICRWM